MPEMSSQMTRDEIEALWKKESAEAKDGFELDNAIHAWLTRLRFVEEAEMKEGGDESGQDSSH
jgi:hypothetical protein